MYSASFQHRDSHVRGRVIRARHLAALAALFWAVTPLEAFRITEVLYHSNEVDDPTEQLEFIEIFNDSSVAADVSGFYFSDGIRFTFPEGTFIRSREYLVVCADVEAVKARYGIENAVGNFSGRLDNGGERITLVNQVGSPLTSVRYRDDEGWPVGADGTGYTLVLKNSFSFSAERENWTRSPQLGGTPGFENFPDPIPLFNEIFPEGQTWRFKKGFDDVAEVAAEFSDPKDAWFGVAFDDSSWDQVVSPVGFNEDGLGTELDDMRRRYIAFALRRTFTVTQEELDAMASLVLRLRIDDGAVAYLNGEPVVLFNMRDATSAEEVTAESRATRSREMRGDPLEFEIPKEKLKVGENLLAIQVHNSTVNSSDAGVAVSVGYRTFRFFDPPHVPKFLINEVVAGAPQAERGVELVNRLNMSMSLAGYHLTDDPLEPAKYTIPDGVQIDPRGFVMIAESDLGFSLAESDVSLFLYAPGGESLESAAAIENPTDLPAAIHSHVRYPDGSDRWWITETPTLGAPNEIQVEDGIVINEIMFNPRIMGDDGHLLPETEIGEYVELHNRTGRAISLDGYRLTSGIDFDFGPDHTIAPGGYLVVARNVDYIRETYGLAAGQVVGLRSNASQEELQDFGSLSNQGETIRLRDPLGNPVDEVAYFEEGEWDAQADRGGSSLELIDPQQDNGSPAAWSASDESTAAPWTEISYVAPGGHVPPGSVFSEMHLFLLSAGECLIDGVSITDADGTEYLTNGDFEEDSRPWRLWGNHDTSFQTNEDAKIGQGSLHLVATGGGNNKVNRLEVTTSPRLPRADVRVTLWARWLKGSNALHVSGHNNAFGATIWLELPERPGSPGEENGVTARLREETGSVNLGPVISKVKHSPAVPRGGTPIQFEARVTDSDGVAAVELIYEVDGSDTEQLLPLTRESDDDSDLDHRYTGQLDGFVDDTIINFRVRARDALGNERVFPTTALDRNYSLIVAPPAESSSFRYRMILNRASNARLNSQLLHSNNLVPGTFVFEESEVYYDVGFRYHGSPWQRPGSPRMFRARFKGDNRFRGEVKRVNLSRYGDNQEEGSAYQFCRKASVPGAIVPHSPRYEYYRLTFNSRHHGTLAEIRVVDKDYADFNWPDDAEGTAYKITGKLTFPNTNFNNSNDWTRFRLYRTGPYAGEDHAENLRFYFNPKLRKDEDDFEPLIRLLLAMDQSTTPSEVYQEEIEKHVNVESWLRTFIVRVLQDDWDTIDIQNGQNAYLYHAPDEDRFYLVPWDMDNTYGNTSATLVPTGGSRSGTGRMYSVPKYRRLYGSLVKEYIDNFWNVEYVTHWTQLVQETAAVSGSSVLNFVRGRLTQIQNRLLRTSTRAEFEITTPSPTGVDGTSLTIEGTAPLEVRRFFVQVGARSPEPVEVMWRAPGSSIPVDWSLEVSGLEPGPNDIQVFAFDRVGDLVDSGRLEVHNTAGREPPLISEVDPIGGPEEGGTRIRVFGTGFEEPLTMRVGGEEATDVRRVSANELSAVTPPGPAGPADVEVSILGTLTDVLEGGFTYGLDPRVPFTRGEVNGDASVDLADALAILGYIFQRGQLSCRDAADVNDDGSLTISDPTSVILYLFSGGRPPAAPFPGVGVDPTEDDLDCDP